MANENPNQPTTGNSQQNNGVQPSVIPVPHPVTQPVQQPSGQINPVSSATPLFQSQNAPIYQAGVPVQQQIVSKQPPVQSNQPQQFNTVNQQNSVIGQGGQNVNGIPQQPVQNFQQPIQQRYVPSNQLQYQGQVQAVRQNPQNTAQYQGNQGTPVRPMQGNMIGNNPNVQQYVNPQFPNQQYSNQQLRGQQPVMNPQFQNPQFRPNAQVVPPRKAASPQKLIAGCLGCFGFALVLFVVFVLIFVGQTNSNGENPMAKSFGMDTASFINSLVTVVNIVFGGLFILLFLMAIIGLFRFLMARKDDKDTKKKGLTMAGISTITLIVISIIWVGMYSFISSKKVYTPKSSTNGIVTTPASTLGLIAPIEIQFDATKLPINKNKFDILSYDWDFGDGGSSQTINPKHVYDGLGKKNGRYDVTLLVAKRDKQTKEETTDKYTTIVTISNELNASFTTSVDKGPAPLKVDFDASASSTPSGEIATYEWDFKGDSKFTDATGKTTSYEFNKIGTYNVSLRISDGNNPPNYRTISKTITVEGSNIPTAVIDIPTSDGKYLTNKQYVFKGDKSTSPSGKISKYEWDFGDGSQKANTRISNHIFKTAGSYTITLTVSDADGVSGQATQNIKVEKSESAPIAAITTVPATASKDKSISGTVPFEVKFDASTSQDPDNNIVDYNWDFDGDGQSDASGETANYVYKNDGVFNATLEVIDANNNSSKATVVVKVGSQPLQARLTATPIEGVNPLTVAFDATGSSYPNGQIVSYEWDFGDGTAKRIDTAQVQHKYDKIGTFTAKVTAIASDNTKSTVETPINVRPTPLTACFTPVPTEGEAPLTVEFDPRCSTGSVLKFSWDFGDGENSRIRKPTHTFSQPGNYQVTLEVSDSQNVVNTYKQNILVKGTVNQ